MQGNRSFWEKYYGRITVIREFVYLMCKNNYNDISEYSERFTKELFQIIFKEEIKNLNEENDNKNFPTIDLWAEKSNVAIQVTSQCKIEKAKKTLREYKRKNLYECYGKKLYIVFWGFYNPKKESILNLKEEAKNFFEVEIIRIDRPNTIFRQIDYSQKEEIIEFLDRELDCIAERKVNLHKYEENIFIYGEDGSFDLLIIQMRKSEVQKKYLDKQIKIHIKKFLDILYELSLLERKLLYHIIIMEYEKYKCNGFRLPIKIDEKIISSFFMVEGKEVSEPQNRYERIKLTKIMKNLKLHSFLSRDMGWGNIVLSSKKKYEELFEQILNYGLDKNIIEYLYKLIILKDCSAFSSEIEENEYEELWEYE